MTINSPDRPTAQPMKKEDNANGNDRGPLLDSRVCLAIAVLGLSFLIGSLSFAGEAIYDRDGNLKYRIDGNGRIYDRDWNLKGRIRRR